ncbi:MAG: response regulator [Thiomargarita sp.]|nr:response regulator [Thiomargarita sp.]
MNLSVIATITYVVFQLQDVEKYYALFILLIIFNLLILLVILYLIQRAKIANRQALESKFVKNQNWVKSKLTELYEKMRGELEFATVGQKIINFIIPALDAPIGAIYYNENGVLKLAASNAYTTATEFEFGEGLLGQAASEQKSILFSDIPNDYIKVRSALGEAKPHHILVTPLIFGDQVKGVLELGLSKPLSERQTNLLQQAVEHIAIRFKSIESHAKIQALLEESQEKSRELEKQQDAVEQQRKWFEVTLSNVGDGIITTDVSMHITFMNPVAENMTGWTFQAAQGRLFTDVFDIINGQTRQPVKNPIEQVIREGSIVHLPEHTVLIAQDAREIPMEDSSVPVRNKKGELLGVALIFHDIIEQLENERKLIKAKEEADVAKQTKTAFLANMNHELRTPLNSILGYTQILKRDEALSAKQQDSIDIIRRSGELLLILINDLLELSKIEVNKLELYPTDFHFGYFIKDITALFQMRVKQKGISFTYEAQSPLPTCVHADEKRLRQIMLHLLGNAIKFTEQGEVSLKISYSYQEAVFQIEDTGCGIISGEFENIFVPFQQLCDKKHQIEGIGLGLSITKKLVELMGGKLHVESTVGKGSTFWVMIKLSEVPGFERLEATKKSLIIGFKGTPHKILVIDDDDAARTFIVTLLTSLGFDVIETMNGKEGVEKALVFKPDVILMDLMMPLMNGFEATRRIRQTSELKEVVIIAISGSVYEQDRKDSLLVGCNDFIAKPIQSDELLEKLRLYLELEWTYQEDTSNLPNHSPETVSEDDKKIPMIAPPPKLAEALYQLAMKGDVGKLMEEAKELQSDKQLAPFADELLQLANNFKVRKIRELIKPFLTQK